jgi:hypothetical protein
MKLPKSIKIMTYHGLDIELWETGGGSLGIAVVNAAGEPLWQKSVLRDKEEIEKSVRLACNEIEAIAGYPSDSMMNRRVIQNYKGFDIELWWNDFVKPYGLGESAVVARRPHSKELFHRSTRTFKNETEILEEVKKACQYVDSVDERHAKFEKIVEELKVAMNHLEELEG